MFENSAGNTQACTHWVSPETPPMSGRFKWYTYSDTEPEWMDINASGDDWNPAYVTDYGWVKGGGGLYSAAIVVVTTPNTKYPRVGTYLGGFWSGSANQDYYNFCYCSEFESGPGHVVQKIDPKFLPPNRFVVNVTSDDNGNLTADKTIAEIIEAYEAGKDVVASPLDAGIEYQLYAISKIELGAVFDVSIPGHNSRGLSITNTGVNLTDSLNIPKIYPVDAELIGQMNVPVGVDNDGRLFSENPSINVPGGSDIKMKVFNQLAAGKTVRCALTELRGKLFTLLPYSYNFSGSGYCQLHGVAIEGNYDLSLPVRFYRYISETGMDGAKLFIHPFDNEIIAKDGSGKAYRFCGEIISDTTLTEARSIYHAQRPLLTYNNEPFITAELTDNSITIVYMGKGEDGQYGVQKTTFGGITWKSETT